jgi:hypothetical protein
MTVLLISPIWRLWDETKERCPLTAQTVRALNIDRVLKLDPFDAARLAFTAAT